MNADIIIVGCGVSGLCCALNISAERNVIILSKDIAENSDSYLAQGGICVLRDDDDYDVYFEDTMKAGHYLNNKKSVDIMLRESGSIINDLVEYGVEFTKKDGEFVYTREGAHSSPRILFHKDITGKEITSKLLDRVKERKNITLIERFTVVDIVKESDVCCGVVGYDEDGEFKSILADYTVLATGGIGGLYEHTTNFTHLTGDGVAIALKNSIGVKDIDYIQIHPTTLYSKNKGRSFLISESVRGEGAVLLNANKERFVDELLPRDIVTKAIFEQMKKDNTDYVWLSFKPISETTIKEHFPNIYKRCLEEGYDVTRECIPVVPAQHYFMGGIDVNEHSKTTMERLYAVGETACNGVHGKNRLASNSLLESLVFAKRAAKNIEENYSPNNQLNKKNIDFKQYNNYEETYKKLVLDEIEKEKNKR